ncbi:MAG: endolytic transglycosylase MltG [Campylobacterales bacterium]|nr:endolytic transglycosylase MltG [Campylobacterales bacterium]
MIISFMFYITIPIKTTSTVLVPQGSITNIISHFGKHGYAVSKIDKYILWIMGTPQSGWINIGKNRVNRIDFFYKIVNGETKLVELQLIPGDTLVLFFEKISKELSLDATKLMYYYNELSRYPEAGIFADTYHVPYGISESALIRFLIKESELKYKQLSKKIYGVYDKKQWEKILITASIIQKEAASNEEMPLVASVIYNRLAKGMALQMDGTLNYGEYSNIKVTPERIKNDVSRYNTYKYKGLPLKPVCAVSADAILAAIKPANTKYLYFMRQSDGKHQFSQTYNQHLQSIQKRKRDLR